VGPAAGRSGAIGAGMAARLAASRGERHAAVRFPKVAMRPDMPRGLGMAGTPAVHVFILPGNPVRAPPQRVLHGLDLKDTVRPP
jgi:molybdopterin biosynthesis enzyme